LDYFSYRHGRLPVYQASVVLFARGPLWISAAPSFDQLLFDRAIQNSMSKLFARMLGQTEAEVRSEDNAAPTLRANDLSWPVCRHTEQIRLLLPHGLNPQQIVEARNGKKKSALSVQPITLKVAYFEFVGDCLLRSNSI
jgi:hypothetical protein